MGLVMAVQTRLAFGKDRKNCAIFSCVVNVMVYHGTLYTLMGE